MAGYGGVDVEERAGIGEHELPSKLAHWSTRWLGPVRAEVPDLIIVLSNALPSLPQRRQ